MHVDNVNANIPFNKPTTEQN